MAICSGLGPRDPLEIDRAIIWVINSKAVGFSFSFKLNKTSKCLNVRYAIIYR